MQAATAVGWAKSVADAPWSCPVMGLWQLRQNVQILGKYEYFRQFVLAGGSWYLCWWLPRVRVCAGLRCMCWGISTRSLAILYIMHSLWNNCLLSSVSKPYFSNNAVTVPGTSHSYDLHNALHSIAPFLACLYFVWYADPTQLHYTQQLDALVWYMIVALVLYCIHIDSCIITLVWERHKLSRYTIHIVIVENLGQISPSNSEII